MQGCARSGLPSDEYQASLSLTKYVTTQPDMACVRAAHPVGHTAPPRGIPPHGPPKCCPLPLVVPAAHSHHAFTQINWLKGNALQPETYAHLLPGATAVVHTLGTLLEDGRYKAALKDGDIPTLARTFLSGLVGGSNPLEDVQKDSGYTQLNHDAGTWGFLVMSC